MDVLGIDFGGSGIKGALVDTKSGALKSERHRIKTPDGAAPDDVAATCGALARHFDWRGPIGIGFPAVIWPTGAQTAANISKKWIGCDPARIIGEATGCEVVPINDADAAGIAEMAWGAGAGERGVVFMVTLGTGIGTALFVDGRIVPNTELGHLYLGNGKEGEAYASSKVREDADMAWGDWGVRVNTYLVELQRLFWPELIIIGGGASKHFAKYADKITVPTRVVPARLLNHAGIIGAAMHAANVTSARKPTSRAKRPAMAAATA